MSQQQRLPLAPPPIPSLTSAFGFFNELSQFGRQVQSQVNALRIAIDRPPIGDDQC
jgi:hypothetical protein